MKCASQQLSCSLSWPLDSGWVEGQVVEAGVQEPMGAALGLLGPRSACQGCTEGMAVQEALLSSTVGPQPLLPLWGWPGVWCAEALEAPVPPPPEEAWLGEVGQWHYLVSGYRLHPGITCLLAICVASLEKYLFGFFGLG